VWLVVILASANVGAATPSPGTVIESVDHAVIQPEVPKVEPVTNGKKSNFTPPTYEKKIEVNRFDLSGNTLFDDELLLAQISAYTNTPITLAQIYEAADNIQSFYRSKGYLLTSVYVPAQKISSGTVRLEVIEGRLASIGTEGILDSYQSRFLVDQVDTLKLGDIITGPALEREMLLLNDLPGLSARAVILPGAAYGTSDIAIQAVEDRSSMTLRVNNHGRKSLGEGRLEAGWLYANPFSQGDQLNLSAILAEQSRMTFLRADYDALINNSGTRLGGGISSFNYKVDTNELGLNGTLKGDGVNLRLQLSHPWLRSKRNRLDVSTVIRSSETSEDGSLAVSKDSKSISVIDFKLNWQFTHNGGSSSVLATTLSTNFKGNADGSKTDAEKAKLTIDYSFSVPFAQRWFALAQISLVASADPLPDVERFRLGGPDSVRAYASAELAGDEGGLLRLDVGRRFDLFANTSMIVKLFGDTGKVKRTMPAAGEVAEQTLTGYGIGARVDIGRQHTIELEAVTPTTDLVSSDGRDSRVWLNYSARF